METSKKEQIISVCKNELNKTIVKIASQFKISRHVIHRILKSENINRQLLKFNHNFFETIDTEEKAYWLGFVFADGCICDTSSSSKSLNINLAIIDDHHIEKFQQHINSKLNLHYKKTDNCVYVRYYSNKLCDDLIRLGCTPRKSLTLKFPNINKNLYRHFIRGYIDGDGCICFRKNGNLHNLQIAIIGTEEFLSSLQNIFLKELNIKHKKLQNKGNVKGLTINGNLQCRKITNWIYKNNNICLDRKFAKTLL